MENLLFFIFLLTYSSVYLTKFDRRILGVKPIHLPFVLLGFLALTEAVSVRGVPVVSIASLPFIIFLIWLNRKLDR